MRTATINELWSGYSARVLPATASKPQRIETRRAFYAGAFAVLTEMRSTLGSDEVSEDEGVKRLELWLAELTQFYRDVKQGRA